MSQLTIKDLLQEIIQRGKSMSLNGYIAFLEAIIEELDMLLDAAKNDLPNERDDE